MKTKKECVNLFVLTHSFFCFRITLFNYPKSSNNNISGGTPKLSNIILTELAIGPGPHM